MMPEAPMVSMDGVIVRHPNGDPVKSGDVEVGQWVTFDRTTGVLISVSDEEPKPEPAGAAEPR